MATSLRFLKINYPLMFNSVLKNTSLNGTVSFGINRFIFSDTSLGVSGYTNARSQMHQQFANVENSFRHKMNEIVQNENSVIFTEDLKAILHLVNKTPEDINLVLQMIKKFNTQNKDLRFGTYVFGPVIMRTFYYLDEPDVALNTFLDKNLISFFDQNMSHVILLTLLYKHEKYSDVRKVYDIIKSRSINAARVPINLLIVAAASCYKENTAEALQFALDAWKELTQRGIQPVRRVVTFTAGLAIKQNIPEAALDVLSGLRSARYIDNRCLKIVAYCKLDRLIDVISMLKFSVEGYNIRKECYFYDTLEIVKECAEKTNDDDVKSEINKLLNSLAELQLIDKYVTLETHLNKTIERSHVIHKRERPNTFRRYNEESRKKFDLKDLL